MVHAGVEAIARDHGQRRERVDAREHDQVDRDVEVFRGADEAQRVDGDQPERAEPSESAPSGGELVRRATAPPRFDRRHQARRHRHPVEMVDQSHHRPGERAAIGQRDVDAAGAAEGQPMGANRPFDLERASVAPHVEPGERQHRDAERSEDRQLDEARGAPSDHRRGRRAAQPQARSGEPDRRARARRRSTTDQDRASPVAGTATLRSRSSITSSGVTPCTVASGRTTIR